MAFTLSTMPYARQNYFQYFATGDEATNSIMAESLAPGYEFEIGKIRIHLSTAHASVVDFIVTTSHHLGSQYNETLVSQAMNGVQDVLFPPDRTLKYKYDDTLLFSMVMSAANTYGIEVSGWAITQA